MVWIVALIATTPPQATFSVAGTDGSIAFMVPAAHLRRMQTLVLVAGLLIPLAGAVAAWAAARWLQAADRALANGEMHPAFPAAGTRIADSDRQQRRWQDECGLAKDLQQATATVHQRFLAQLGQEVSVPLRRLVGSVERLEAQGGHLDPGEASACRRIAGDLEERVREVLGLAPDVTPSSGGTTGAVRMPLDRFLGEVAELVTPTAAARQVTVVCEADSQPVTIHPRLLSQMLVNLLTNGIHAAPGGSRVRLQGVCADRRLTLRVIDAGSGLTPDLAARVATACQAGGFVPGEPGIGLGLAIVLANARALAARLSLRTGADGTTMTVDLDT